MNKSYGIQRVISFLIDIFIVIIISSLITSPFFNNSDTSKYYDEFNEIKEKYSKKEIKTDEYFQDISDLSYNIDYNTVPQSIASAVIYICYFGILQYYFKGQTIGKKIFKIKVISADEKEASLNQLTIRSLFNTGLLISIINIFLVIFIDHKLYFYINLPLQYLQIIIYVVLLFMIFIRKDGQGFHDKLAKTKVIVLERK